MPEAKTSARRIESAERRKRALQLRLAGASFPQIAATPRSATDPTPMYSSRKRAHEAVTAALKELREETRGSAEELRTLELARLESMQVALWPSTRPVKAVTEECPNCQHQVVMYREPDKEAVDRVIKIMERRSRYLGLDAGGKADETSGVDDARSMLAGVAKGLHQVYQEIVAEEAAAAADDGPEE